MDIRTLCCIGVLALASTPASSAEIKRWVDKDGQVHFSDLAPQDVENEQITPKVITTTPSSNHTLKKIMRPGELRMIKNYEKRGKRLIKAKEQASKQAKSETRRIATAKNRCSYNRRQKEQLKNKLRRGVSRSEKNRIEQNLIKYNQRIKEYCY
jgi:hypothetical protein